MARVYANLKLEAEAKQKAKQDEASKARAKPKDEMHAKDRGAVDRDRGGKVSPSLREKDAEVAGGGGRC